MELFCPAHLLRPTRVDDILDVRNRDCGLGNIRRDDDQSVAGWRFLEDLHLPFCREQRVQGQDMHRLVGILFHVDALERIVVFRVDVGLERLLVVLVPCAVFDTLCEISPFAEVNLLSLEIITDLDAARQLSVQRAIKLGIVAIRPAV